MIIFNNFRIPFHILALLIALSLIGCNNSQLHHKIFEQSDDQLRAMLADISITEGFPRTTTSDGSRRMVKSTDWTSGFFPGTLWYQSEYSNDKYFQQQAEKYTEMLEDEQFNDKDHDIGFKMFCSYGNGYRLTGNPKYRDILITSAHTLSKRFNPKTGSIRSWDRWTYPVIIDNMMNLELLFWVAKETDNDELYDIASTHAHTTLKNHFRDDYSSYHLVQYDTITGRVIEKKTYQGFADESSWARGQAWGLYGMTMTYRETQDKVFLKQALGIANYIMNNDVLKTDGVPFWDFDDPSIPNAPRDASAAAVICSALYELVKYAPEDQKDTMLNFADNILKSLASNEYFAQAGTNNNFLLMHSTGFRPKNREVDVPLIYADYYFLEAATRRKNLNSQYY